MFKKAFVVVTIVGAVIAAWSSVAAACGGFFCQNDPVDQVGERIVFTQNPDETITALIEILYQGSADDFSWILPIPGAIDADALDVPVNGARVFDELHRQTDVQFIPPLRPECATNFERAMEDEAEEAMEDEGDGGVEIFASGEVGPFEFDVIGSEDPDALIDWLRGNDYRVTRAMVPLLDIYVEQDMAFIAMRLLDGETSDSISPIEITYEGTEPMIPLQLTAVAAQRQMPIWVWLFGESQAVSTNFAEIEIATEELTFFTGGGSGIGGNDYIFLVQDRADALGGQAFITEYAQGVEPDTFIHPWLQEQAEDAPYLTRLSTFIDPDEMTADPTFGFDDTLEDVSRTRSARDLTGLYDCERFNGGQGASTSAFAVNSDAIDPTDGTGQVVAFTPDVPEREVEEDTVEIVPTGGEDLAIGDIDGESSGNLMVIFLSVLGTVLVLGVIGLGFATGRVSNR